MATIAVKNVDQKLYRKVKALASLRGRTVGDAVNEALAMWVQLVARGVSLDEWIRLEEQARINNQLYEQRESELLEKHRGKHIIIAGGKLLGPFEKEEQAYAVAKKRRASHAIATRLEEKPARVIELGWSIMEQLA